MRDKRKPIALFILCLIGFQSAWLAALPAFHGMDEFDHAFRAGSVAQGYWSASHRVPADGRGYLIRTPASLVTAAHDRCSSLNYTGSANCSAASVADGEGNVLVASAAATYNPLYYSVVGLAGVPFDGFSALLAMRIVSLLLCDLVLALALAVTLSRGRGGVSILALAVVSTPTIVYSTIVVAPNGLGFCGAILLWSSLLALPSRVTDRDPGAGPWWGLTIGSSLLMATHSTGPMWWLLILACGSPLWIPRLMYASSVRPRQLQLVAALNLMAFIGAMVWIVTAGTNDPRTEEADFGPLPAAQVASLPLLWLLQSVATLGMRNQPAPIWVYAMGLAMLTAFVIVSWRRSRRPARRAVLAVASASLLVPLVATWLAHPYVGAAWQGRYGFPLFVGVYFVLFEAWGQTRRASYSMLSGVVTAVGALQLGTTWGLLDAELDSGSWTAETPWIHYVMITLGCLAGAGALYAAARCQEERATDDRRPAAIFR